MFPAGLQGAVPCPASCSGRTNAMSEKSVPLNTRFPCELEVSIFVFIRTRPCPAECILIDFAFNDVAAAPRLVHCFEFDNSCFGIERSILNRKAFKVSVHTAVRISRLHGSR